MRSRWFATMFAVLYSCGAERRPPVARTAASSASGAAAPTPAAPSAHAAPAAPTAAPTAPLAPRAAPSADAAPAAPSAATEASAFSEHARSFFPSWAHQKGKVLEQRHTAAGQLTIVEIATGTRYAVRLDQKPILFADEAFAAQSFSGEGFVRPHIYQSLGPVRPYAEVLLMQQQAGGNACNGGPLWFLGLGAHGAFALSEVVDFCGGRDPQAVVHGDRVTLTLPGGPPNRGTVTIPSEIWEYEAGKVHSLTHLAR